MFNKMKLRSYLLRVFGAIIAFTLLITIADVKLRDIVKQ